MGKNTYIIAQFCICCGADMGHNGLIRRPGVKGTVFRNFRHYLKILNMLSGPHIMCQKLFENHGSALSTTTLTCNFFFRVFSYLKIISIGCVNTPKYLFCLILPLKSVRSLQSSRQWVRGHDIFERKKKKNFILSSFIFLIFSKVK